MDRYEDCRSVTDPTKGTGDLDDDEPVVSHGDRSKPPSAARFGRCGVGIRRIRTSTCLGVIGIAFLSRIVTAAIAEVDDPPNVADVPALVEAHNRERALKQLPALSANPKLEAAALAHARDMASRGKMTHEGADGSTPVVRIDRQDYHHRATAENVAAGQPTVAIVMKSWIDSPPHEKNILGDYSEMGAACVKSEDGTPYWCVTFGLPWPSLDPMKARAAVLDELNRARSQAKKPRLKVHRQLEAAAQRHAHDNAMRDAFRAEDDDGLTPVRRLQRDGYQFSRVAESTASGQPTPEEVVRTWLEDKGNREAILGNFREVGVGYATAKKGNPYWCLIIARP